MQVPQTEITVRREDGVVLLQKTVPPGDYVLGRAPEVELSFEAELVSRRHAQLTINFDHAFIQDLGSSNGTLVNGQPVTEITRLWPNQRIQIGAATVELRRVKTVQPSGVSLAPAEAAVQRLLPEELLRERKYDIGKIVAQGGMGAILNAKDAATERTVAMKVMLDASSPDALARFVAEARITAQLEHPNIVPVHELSVDENGQPYYTMKMVRGITLRKVLELLAKGVPETARKYPLLALLTIFQKACDALAFAHSKGVIHRDLKPENLMLDDFGVVLVMDWGLAKVTGKKEALPGVGDRSSIHTLPPEATGATLDGTIMGTPAFMSPEQARGEVEDLDLRSDIYALGAILFQILHLRPPYSGRSVAEIVDKVQRGEVAWPDAKSGAPQKLTHLPGGSVPHSLLAVCKKALAFDRNQRYSTTEELQRDLSAYQTGFATTAEKAGLGKQLVLALRRHKTASLGTAVVLVVSATFGGKALVEGRRAGREVVRANAALADLKKSAPALLKLGKSEADAQHFVDALHDIDAAVSLDATVTDAYWQRVWVLLGLERWSEAAAAVRLARQKDSSIAKFASLLPSVEKLAAASDGERWKSDAAREIFGHLQSAQATGPLIAFAGRLSLKGEERRELADQRLLAAFGKGNYQTNVGADGTVRVVLTAHSISTLEPLRGMPIDHLNASQTLVSDLEPLRGLHLQSLDLSETKVTDLSPLRGMPIAILRFRTARVVDLSPLSGMPLQILDLAENTEVSDITPLAGMPLTDLNVSWTRITHLDALRGMPLTKLDAGHTKFQDGSPLKGAPLQSLSLTQTRTSDLSFLKGMPLRSLHVGSTNISDIAALRGLPIESLDLYRDTITDLSPLRGAPVSELFLPICKKLTDFAPVLTLPRLEWLKSDEFPKGLLPLRESKSLQTIDADAYPGEDHHGPRLVAEFWKSYDAHRAQVPK